MQYDKIKAIIIEDSPSDSAFFKSGLADFFASETELIGECMDIDTAYTIISRHRPELWILDIELSKGTGFALLNNIVRDMPEYKFSVLFVTAYKDQILEALKYTGMQYATKPLGQTEFVSAIQALLHLILMDRENFILRKENEAVNQNYNRLLDQIKGQAIHITTPGAMNSRVEIHKIDHIVSDGHYCKFILENESSPVLASESIGTFEDQLCKNSLHFFRIHNCYIVQKHHISVIRKSTKSVLMKSNKLLPVARRRWEDFMKFWEGR